MIDEDPSDRRGGDGKEVRFVAEYGSLLIDELEIGLVDQRRCLQRVVRPLELQQMLCEPAELVVDEGRQLIGGAGVARGYLDRPELTAQRFPVGDPLGSGERRKADLVSERQFAM